MIALVEVVVIYPISTYNVSAADDFEKIPATIWKISLWQMEKLLISAFVTFLSKVVMRRGVCMQF